MTRRQLARMALAGTALTEAAFAQRALVAGELPKDMVWLNANENPLGPPAVSLRAMTEALPTAGRYHFQEFRAFTEAVARSEGLEAEWVLAGAGSSEPLQIAVQAFTAPDRPLIAMEPSFELPGEVARTLGHPVIPVPLTTGYFADVRRMAAEAAKARGGLLYVCNPNNPTGAVTPRRDIDWLAANLPANTVLIVDEAYIHFADTPEMASALEHVRVRRNVIVARTFSKIYGMAGLRVGFTCAPPEITARLARRKNNVISIVSARAALAALGDRDRILAERRTGLLRTRAALYKWLEERGLRYIPSHANFLMIDIGRPPGEFGMKMMRLGVAPGRPFPPLDTFLRVSIGTDADMEKFREVFWKVYRS